MPPALEVLTNEMAQFISIKFDYNKGHKEWIKMKPDAGEVFS